MMNQPASLTKQMVSEMEDDRKLELSMKHFDLPEPFGTTCVHLMQDKETEQLWIEIHTGETVVGNVTVTLSIGPDEVANIQEQRDETTEKFAFLSEDELLSLVDQIDPELKERISKEREMVFKEESMNGNMKVTAGMATLGDKPLKELVKNMTETMPGLMNMLEEYRDGMKAADKGMTIEQAVEKLVGSRPSAKAFFRFDDIGMECAVINVLIDDKLYAVDMMHSMKTESASKFAVMPANKKPFDFGKYNAGLPAEFFLDIAAQALQHDEKVKNAMRERAKMVAGVIDRLV